MEQGGDIKSVFGRLSRGVAAIEAGLKKVTGRPEVFMSDPVLGMITCCPSNLGTCMRGSVHILVPKLIATIGFEAIDKIARGMNCQARGSTGEHSEVIDRIDISNWRRLGFTEYSLVQDMIRCANELSKMEDATPQPPVKFITKKTMGPQHNPSFDLIMDEDLAENRWPRALEEAQTKAKQTGGHLSLMGKVVTKELFEELKDLKSSNGWTLARAINTGVCNPDSFVGCHTGDLESMALFKKLFNPVCEQ